MLAFVVAAAGSLAAAGCLGQYNPPTDPAPQQSQPKPQPAPTPSPPASPTPSPSPTPAPSPQPTPAPSPTDGGTPAPTPATACDQLVTCCHQLPADAEDQCLSQVQGLDDASCQSILDQLQQNGLCL